MRTLQPADVSLNGNNLIEASAGTGKTFTIATLYLRLLAERSLGVDQILVVTFTKAATAELRERLRDRLRLAVAVFGGAEPPAELADVLNQLVADAGDPNAVRRHLLSELRRFDEAAIFTIHGFCQRMLRDNAFESGLVFDAELVTDAAPLLTEVVQDFWAREVYDAPERFVRHLVERKLTADGLMDLAGQAVADPELEVLPSHMEVDTAEVEARFLAAHEGAAALWRDTSEVVGELLLTSPALNRNQWRLPSTRNRLDELETLFTADPVPTSMPPDLVRFTPERIVKATKKKQDPPAHPLFVAIAELLEAQVLLEAALDAQLMNLRLDLMDYARREIRRRREASRTLSYDDLLHQLERALRGPSGATLGRIIRERFKAALIDEFQDTDPVQDRIFREIFTARESLFLIGDPKQAIYGFRRADIYTYLAAGDRVRSSHDGAADPHGGCYTLGTNYRSDPGLIRAVNTIHQRARDPFLDMRIEFEPVNPRDGRQDGLAGSTRHARPLELMFVSRQAAGADPLKPINKGWAVDNLPGRIAAEIARLLASDTTLDGSPLEPGHVAILIRRNAEAAPLQDALRQLGIPSVLHSDANVFQTPEAHELERVLRALAEPSRDGLVRTALATTLFGLPGEELQRLSADEDDWQRWIERFEDWTRQWRDRGFMLAFRGLAERQRVPERLLGLPDGERRLTNLLHLAELLHQAASTEHLGPDGLAHWLGEMRAEADEGGGGGDESRQMRMESDALAVQILTMHKAKGLEYAVVFCPYLWDAGPQPGSGDFVRFHDPEQDHRVKLDVGSPELGEHQDLAAREGLAERLRITYVALTRARHRTVVVWGAFRDSDKTGLGYLLHQPTGDAGDLAAETQARVRGADDDELRADLQALAERAGGTIVVRELGDENGPVYAADAQPSTSLEARSLQRSLDGRWRTASFSALASSRPTLSHVALEGRDLDEADDPAEAVSVTTAPETPVVLHDFPRGARAGNLLHAIFEQLDFTSTEAVGPLVRALLPRFGYEPTWGDVLEQALSEILSTPLDEGGDMKLADVAPDRRLVELEFVFPVAQHRTSKGAQTLAPVDVRRLSGVFAKHGSEQLSGYGAALAELRFVPVRGYLRGFIDLVFEHEERWYVVDYKSNHLGAQPADYAPQQLLNAMVSHHYPLQYHLYTLALHRYLQTRLPDYDYERHFGGVRYLFLRGMSAERPGCGVFRDRPQPAMVEALSDLVDGLEVDR